MGMELLFFSILFVIGVFGLWLTGGYKKGFVWLSLPTFFILSFVAGRSVGTDWLLYFVPPGTAYIVAIELFLGLLCLATLVAANIVYIWDAKPAVATSFFELCMVYLCMVPFMYWFGYYGFRLILRDC